MFQGKLPNQIGGRMKTFFGIILTIGGVALGFWLGLWVMFVGGIIQVVNSLPHEVLGMCVPADARGIALGILRITLASFVGYVSGSILIYPGINLLKD